MHLFPGFSAILVIAAGSSALFAFSYNLRKDIPAYNHDPQGEKGAYEPFLQKYLHLAEYVIGLASGSVVLLLGAFVLHGHGEHLPWFYRSPLLMVSASVLFGLVFMVWAILSYEESRHGNAHTPLHYSLNEALGFSCLLFFVIGYVWLIWAVTQ